MAKSKNRLLSELINSSNNLTLVDDIPKISFTDSDTNTLASITANSSHLTYTTASAARDHIFKQDDTTRMLIDDLGINVTGTVTANSLAIDNLTVDGYTISSDSALVLDVAGNLTIDVDGTTIVLNDGGLNWGQFFSTGAGAFNIYSPQSNQDIVFRGNDGGTNIIALTLDMSVGGQLRGAPLGVSTPTYAFSNDSNTGMTRPTGDTLQLVTNGQERIRITDVGNVGIGTSSPSAQLHVDGSTGILINDSGTASQTQTKLIPINSGGNSLLKVKGGNYIHTVAYETSWNDFEYARLVSSYNTGDSRFDLKKSASDGSTAATTRISTGTSYFNGDVGIGTDSPQTGLQVAHDWVNDYGSINISSGQNVLGGLGLRANNVYKGGLIYRDGTAGAYWELTAYGNEPLLFKTNNAERMRIDSSGRLLLGVASATGYAADQDNFIIKGSAEVGMHLIGGTSSTIGINFGDGTSTDAYKGQIVYHNADDSMRLQTAGSERMRIVNTGRVGINDTSPQGMLHVTSDSTTVDALYLESNVDSSSAAPVATFHRHSASPADADYLGQLKFKGENDADQEVVYAKITAKIQDASDGSEDGLIEFANKKAGSNVITARLRSDSLQLLNGTSLTVAGDATITGNLTVNGSTTTINSTTLTVDDKNIVLASGAADSSAANGAGITVDGANANITYTHATAEWDFNKSIHVSGAAGSGVKIDSGGAIVGGGATGGDTQLIYWGGGPMYYGRSSLGGTVSGHELRVGGVTKLNVNSSGNTIVSGNIGIGTSSPARRLTVQGGSGDNLPVRIIGGSGTNHGSIEFQDPNTTADYKVTIGSKADDFYIQAGGTEKVRVKSDGSVGIGTSSPNSYTNQRVLTINGTTHSRIDFETGDTLRGSVYGDSGSLNIDAGGNFVRFYAGNAEKMRLTNTGRLGIGITNPSSILHIHGNAGDPAKLTLSEGGATSRIYATRNSDTNSDLRFQTEIGGSIADVMKINYSGELKLGNLALASSTTAPLHVAKGSTDVQAIFGDNNSTIDDPSIRIIGRNTANSAIRYTFMGLDADANHGYIGYNAGAGGFVNALSFDTSGKVGINDASPQDWLEVGVTGARGGITISSTTHNYPALSFARSSTATARIFITEPDATHTSQMYFQTSDASGGAPNLVTAMSIDENQHVGIGTTSPGADLHIENSSGATLFMGDTNGRNLRFRTANSGSQNTNISSYAGLYLGGADNQNHMLIDGNGKVGIGLISPDSRLHVEQAGVEISSTNLDNGTAVGLHVTMPDAEITSGTTPGVAIGLGMNGRARSYLVNTHTGTNKDSSEFSIYTESGGTISESLKVTHVGKVGIGTASPSKKLHIKDSVAHQLQLQGSNSYWNIGTGWSGYYQDFLLFATNSGEKMVIDNAGSVGIGTNSPNTKLHVNKTSSGSFVEAIRIENSGGGVDEGAYINWEVANTSGHGARVGAQREGSGGIALRFDTGEISSAPVERMRINHDGKVLFKPASAQTGYALFDDGVNGGIHIKADTSSITTEYITTGFGAFEEARFVASNFVFKNTGSSTRAVIDDAGNMGIGTTSPVNNGTNSQGLTINGTGNYQNLALQHNGTTQFLMYLNGPSGTFLDQVTADPIMFLTSDTERMRIDASGNVGIGETSPSTKLHVTGGTSSGTVYNTAIFAGGQNSTSGSGARIWLTGCENDPLARGTVIEGISTNNSNAHALVFKTSASSSAPTERMRIDSVGRVGIATTTNHAGSALGYGLTIDSAGYSGSGLEIHRTGNSRFELYQNSTGGQYLDALGSTPFMVLSTGGTERMRINNSGRVGINQSNPAGMLHIQSNDSTTNDSVNMLWLTALSTGTTTTGFGPAIVFQAERNNGVMQNTGKIRSVAEINSGTNISSGISFETGTVGVLNEKMRISYDGLVSFKKASSRVISIGASDSNDKYITLYNSSGNFDVGTYQSANHYLYGHGNVPISFYTNGTKRVTISGDKGEVGIGLGTSAPQGRLEIRVPEGEGGFMIGSSSSTANQNKTQMIQTATTLSGSNVWKDVAYVGHSGTFRILGKSIQSGDSAYGGASADATLSVQYGSASITHHHTHYVAMNGGDVTGNMEYRYLNSGASSGNYRLQVRMPYSGGNHIIYTSITGISHDEIYEDD